MVIKPEPNNPQDSAIFANFFRGLIQVHNELRQGVSSIMESVENDKNNTGLTDHLILNFCEVLLNHHKSEDRFFFPSFRSAGRLKSNDFAFLAARDSEHLDIHRLCLELHDLANNHQNKVLTTPAWSVSVKRTITDLSTISIPHFKIEEITLTPKYIATIISTDELSQVYRNMGEHWNN